MERTPRIPTRCPVVSHLLGAIRGCVLGFVSRSLGDFRSQMERVLMCFSGRERRGSDSAWELGQLLPLDAVDVAAVCRPLGWC